MFGDERPEKISADRSVGRSAAIGKAERKSGVRFQLAAWLLEKYQSWGEAHKTQKPPNIPLPDLLTIISLYWFAGPGPSTWIYRSWVEGAALKFPAGVRVEVPTAICSFRHDISPPSPDEWQDRCYNVVRRSAIDHGGHFPGLDAPAALAEDLSAFVAEVART